MVSNDGYGKLQNVGLCLIKLRARTTTQKNPFQKLLDGVTRVAVGLLHGLIECLATQFEEASVAGSKSMPGCGNRWLLRGDIARKPKIIVPPP